MEDIKEYDNLVTERTYLSFPSPICEALSTTWDSMENSLPTFQEGLQVCQEK
jgi:hypothetical protein